MKRKMLWSSIMLLLFVSQIMAQITGKVQDEYGPLQGALVTVVGTNTSVETDADGAFSIPGKVGDVLDITNPITFGQKTFPVKSLQMGVIKLSEKEVGLDVVVAFGKQKKENLTGAVSVIDSKNFESRPISNAVQALQGKVAGMNFNIGNRGTELGASPSFNVRGEGTLGIGSSASPLVLIDGVEGDFSSLNPQDIESISVLKDAASSSLYGSRAAFGVVLVTTKSGKEGKVSISYNNSLRYSSPTLVPKFLDSETFMHYLNEAYRNNSAASGDRFTKSQIENAIKYKNGEIDYATAFDPSLGVWETIKAWDNVDWYQQMYRAWAPSQEHNLSINGGNEKATYYLSAGYLGQEGLVRYNTDTYDRITLNAKFTANLKSWLKLQYQSRFTRELNGKSSYLAGAAASFYEDIVKKWPMFPVKDTNGNYIYGNGIGELEMGRYKRERDLLNQQVNLTITPLKDWNIYANFSYRTDTDFENRYYMPLYQYDDKGRASFAAPKFSISPYGKIAPGVSFLEEFGYKSNYFSPNIYSDYTKYFGNHTAKLTAGFQAEEFKNRDIRAKRNGIVNRDVIALATTDGDQMYVDGRYNDWATVGFFGRLNYDYDARYLVELNLRYDGTSRFLQDQRWNWYPSVSLGWNVAREGFWQNLGDIFSKISDFKLRASYGELGNQSTTNFYPFYQTMPFKPNVGTWLIDNKLTNTASMPQLISEFLTWERVETKNIGLDLNAFKNRFNLTLDFFERNTKDMVGPARALPGVFGAKVPNTNNTDMRSRGFELALGWNDKVGKDFNYSINATLTDSRQTVINYPNETGSLNTYYSGRELGEIWGFVTHGMAKTDAEINDWVSKHRPEFYNGNWRAGDIMFEDLNKDGKIGVGSSTLEDHGDLKIIGNRTPRYNFGLDLFAQYKGLDLRIFLQGTAKRDLDLDSKGFLTPNTLFTGANTPYDGGKTNLWPATGFKEHLDYFRPEGTTSPLGPNVDAYYPAPSLGDSYKNFPMPQTRYLQNGAYVRVKNIQLGYTLPKKLVQSIYMNRVRFYISGENLFTWTKLSSLFDPEVIGGASGQGKMYPLSKVVSTGISINF
ncbi:SusC/RagA family TonB-linked outer membrane protein [Ornithobacterium rhinotracheale]|uniref:SusC/RagA family TonB-linked outer membrane protein n=1 Tax=Ornithobacterium rhinotracheale TaxID=28251 RepID=UPI001FF30988|nr:TonB-dependent receptor [Ornithobacterium rhinotracheale]MCK0200369.1 TonB-dependent receptor [Ornithobacterium rhinotracheale]